MNKIKLLLPKAHRAKTLLLEKLSPFFPVPTDKIRVHHGADPWGIGGPAVKMQRMQQYFPDNPIRFNIIYTVSAMVPATICADAKKRGVKIVQHINSIYHPSYRPNYKELNSPFEKIYDIADHVVFGSNFAREAAEKYFGVCKAPHTLIYNSIDMQHFTPQKRPEDRFNILAIGKHYVRHRIESLIRALPYVKRTYPRARLLIVGPLLEGEGIYDCSKSSFVKLAIEVGADNSIEFFPQYTQEEAPHMYSLGDILVHLKHMDWTPNTAIESMACGLPVLHSGTGGLPETVGDAGLSLNLPFDWDTIHSPDPEMLADKIIQLYEIRKEKSEIARSIAEERYDLKDWIDQHKRIFEGLFNGI